MYLTWQKGTLKGKWSVFTSVQSNLLIESLPLVENKRRERQSNRSRIVRRIATHATSADDFYRNKPTISKMGYSQQGSFLRWTFNSICGPLRNMYKRIGKWASYTALTQKSQFKKLS